MADVPRPDAASGDPPREDDGARGRQPARGRRERKSMLLRLDPDLHDALARWAADELRSTNAHVEFLLRRALTQSGRLRGSPRTDHAGER
ncbi:MAG TPA: toxin-antitoxin system HicB family antitoxin [Kineosporiaceae bacterium]